MIGPNFQLDADRQHVTVVFPTVPPQALKLDVAGIENLLRKLGDFRSAMEQRVPKTFERGQKVAAISNPRWLLEQDIMLGVSLVHLRDPRYGWLHFALPKSEAANFGKVLLQQAESSPNGPEPSKIN